MLTSLYVIGKSLIHLGPSLVSFLPADATWWAGVHCRIPESLKEKAESIRTKASLDAVATVAVRRNLSVTASSIQPLYELTQGNISHQEKNLI